uniref:Rab-like protein 3 n=1 Tax=Plectus sambesii TaxID=2011161 RepID=A0A914XAV7_9BILA
MMQTSMSLSKSKTDLSDASRDKVKILVLGEAGVGKTTFAQSVKGKAVRNPTWTVGCSVDVVEHSYKAGTPQETLYLIELWDVGGSRSHRNSRHVFYQNAHGVILVHDLENRKSEEALRLWLTELFDDTPNCVNSPLHPSSSFSRLPTFDTEGLAGERSQMPILVVGAKLDMAPQRPRSQIATDCGVDELTLDCRQPISPGSTNGLKLSRFFDRVIDKQTAPTERRRLTSQGYNVVDRRRRLY